MMYDRLARNPLPVFVTLFAATLLTVLGAQAPSAKITTKERVYSAPERREESDVDDRLASGAQPTDARVGVGVAEEEQHLEEEHAGGPNRGRPAEPRQDHLGDHRLHQEEESRAYE